jgi:hypothetical protein
MKAQSIFAVCSSFKWKFVVCPFVDKETNGSYPFANGLNRLASLNILMVLTLSLLVTHVIVGRGILLNILDILQNFIQFSLNKYVQQKCFTKLKTMELSVK